MKLHRIATTLGVAALLAARAEAQSVGQPKPKMPDRHVPPPVTRPVVPLFPPEQIVRADSSATLVAGTYASSADPRGFVMVNEWSGGVVSILSTRNWESIGYLHEGHYSGILRVTEAKQRQVAGSPMGTLHFEALPEGGIRARLRTGGTGTVEIEEMWTRTAQASDSTGSPLDRDPDLPAFGQYVYVEELPEAIHKERPRYPEPARRGGVEGTVVVQALIGKDGAVVTTRVSKLIPELDDAAALAVAKWRFKPATSKGAPVAVWVAVPVQFTLK